MTVNAIGQVIAALGWTSQNQAVISDNLARSSNPGAQEMVLAPLSFNDHVNAGRPTRTDAKHMLSKAHQGGHAVQEKKQASVSLSGNTINAETQLMKANVNAAHFHELKSIKVVFDKVYRLGLK